MNLFRVALKLCVGILLTSGVGTCAAQGLRVSTVVSDLSSTAEDSREVVSASLTLFHNNRAYDYVEAAGEVMIFDPVARRFVILNTARSVRTTITFDELKHMLELRIPQSEAYLKELSRQQTPESVHAARMLRFQLRPKFERSVDASGKLTMTSPLWTYRTETREWPDADEVTAYLDYADWTARLNWILHPSSMFPEPRLQLNNELRQLHGRIPVAVSMDLRPGTPLALRAEHRFTRGLDDYDHRMIGRWDAALNSTQVRELTFRSYQQTMLAGKD